MVWGNERRLLALPPVLGLGQEQLRVRWLAWLASRSPETRRRLLTRTVTLYKAVLPLGSPSVKVGNPFADSGWYIAFYEMQCIRLQ